MRTKIAPNTDTFHTVNITKIAVECYDQRIFFCFYHFGGFQVTLEASQKQVRTQSNIVKTENGQT